MHISPLRSEADYDEALKDIARYFDAEPTPGTAEAHQFDMLTSMIADYEAVHWSINR